MTAQPRASFIETDMLSLSSFSLSDLRVDQSRELAQAVRQALSQVERPRANLGGTGPPGRAD